MNDEEFKAQLGEKDKKIAELQKQLDAEKKAKQQADFQDFCDKAIEKGNILPAQKNAVMDILTAVSDYEPYEFADGTSKTAADMVKDLIGSMKQFDFEEIAKKRNADPASGSIDFSDTEAVAEAIREKQAEFRKKGVELTSAQAYEKLKGE